MVFPKLQVFFFVVVTTLVWFGVDELAAQHGDIPFHYVDGKIAIEFGDDGPVFEGNFPIGGTSEQATGNPGFNTFLPVAANHVIDYKILGPLAYHDGTSSAAVPDGASITIHDFPVTRGSITVDALTEGPISGPGVIASTLTSGFVHSHIDFELGPESLGESEYGAYGLLLSLTSLESDVVTPTGVTDSDPFFIVFNFGLESSQFDRAMGDFATQVAVAVPEPATQSLFGLVGLAMLLRHRRP